LREQIFEMHSWMEEARLWTLNLLHAPAPTAPVPPEPAAPPACGPALPASRGCSTRGSSPSPRRCPGLRRSRGWCRRRPSGGGPRSRAGSGARRAPARARTAADGPGRLRAARPGHCYEWVFIYGNWSWGKSSTATTPSGSPDLTAWRESPGPPGRGVVTRVTPKTGGGQGDATSIATA
jgi:hypothetical protein